jgi:hypothetical protein
MCTLHYVAWSPGIFHFNDQAYRSGSTNSRRKVRLRIKKEKILREKAQNKRGAVRGRSENCVTFAMIIVSSRDSAKLVSFYER